MEEKVVIITGATSMIGRACIQLFGQDKSYKLMCVARSKEKLGHMDQFYIGDMSSREEGVAMVEHTLDLFGRIDVVIHNVAIYPWKTIEELTLSDWQSTLDITLTAPFLVTQACIPHMKKQKGGKIIFMSSAAGEKMGLPHMSAYAAAKAGMNGFMRTAALELAPYNINVNAISPGKMYDPATLTEKERAEKLQNVPLKRFIQPSDVAHLAHFLASDKADNITGQNYVVDGGQSVV